MAHVALGCWPLPVGGRARGRFEVGDVLFLVFSASLAPGAAVLQRLPRVHWPLFLAAGRGGVLQGYVIPLSR